MWFTVFAPSSCMVVIWNAMFSPPSFQAASSLMLSDIENAKTNCWLCFRLICMLISENVEITSGALNPVVHKDCYYSMIKIWNTLSWQ